MIRVVYFPIGPKGFVTLAADLAKHAVEGFFPQIGTFISSTDGSGGILYVLVQVSEPAEIIATTEIPMSAKPLDAAPEVPSNGGAHA